MTGEIERGTTTFMLPDPAPIISRAPVIPVLTIERVADAVPLAQALVAGGLSALEVTLRTPDALDAIAAIVKAVPDAIVGAGTITKIADLDAALKAGAQFLVSPGTPPAFADMLARAPVPVLPGCATVAEAMTLSARGFTILKFFPAEASGGTAWLNAVAGPLPQVRFCPTGGIGAKNAASYLALPNVAAVGGSWVAPKETVASGDFKRITTLSKAAARLRK
jgi:2-dehydro-3-deoxyphosphogluconate aldolase/(4S)-4-hydroxy-2-oxoglutarate aldolase